MLNVLNKVDKKNRYIVFALVMGGFVYTAAVIYTNEFFFYRLGLGFVLIMLSMFFVHYPNIHPRNYLMSLVMPVHLLSGVMLALKYYPNLGDWFRIFVILGVVLLFYIIVLVDNIFFVVGDREESIPLYRVALTWSQILMVLIAIPLYAGLFKIPVNSFLQTTVIALSSFVFSLYQLWVIRHEDRISKIRVGASIIFSLLTVFFTVSIAISTSFLPAEAFLRGLLVATTLLFGLVVISGHLKNEINKSLVLEYLGIISIFLLILLYFKP